MKTPITYYGGKQMIAREIIGMFPKHLHYVEPFAGGAAVFFAKKPSKLETINDKNEMLINFYRTCKNSPGAICKMIESTLYARSEHKRARHIYDNPDEFSNIEKAWALWVLSRMSFSGDVGGAFSVSVNNVNKVKPLVLLTRKLLFMEAIKRLDNAQIEEDDAINIISRYDSADNFFYLDPPYVGCNQGHYSGYTENDFIDLLDVIQGIDGKFILSHYHNDIIDQYTKMNSWNISEHKKQKTCKFAKGEYSQPTGTEILVSNFSVPQMKLFNE